MNELDRIVLYTHGFPNRQVQELLQWMAELRDAKDAPKNRDLFDPVYCRTKLHYMIEDFTSNKDNRLLNIGGLYPIYRLGADYVLPRYKQDNGWVK